jgi:crotonobetainyl-CoA:carnitine CoA-transferase CaiB-like acyl-CoA transferase
MTDEFVSPDPAEQARLPLRGVRVIDFSWIVAGPQATRILADFGAEVIRVEYAGRLDSTRIGMISPGTPAASVNVSGFFSNLNRNKRSITLNLNDPAGLETIRQLLAVSDLVVENYSAGVMESKGLSYETMAAVNPGIIYLSLSGFGHAGRDRDNITWGPTAQAVSGLTFMSGLPGKPAAGWGYSYLDHTAGYFGALAVLFALYHRSLTGQGQYIDISQIETGMVLAGPAILDRSVNGRSYRRPGNPPGNRSTYPALAPHNTYPCKGPGSPSSDAEGRASQTSNDRWIAIAVENEDQWKALLAVMGSPEWALQPELATNSERLRHQDELDAKIAAWTADQDAFDLMLRLQKHGVPAGVVQSMADRMERDPQLASRGFYPEADHPELGRHRFEGVPFQMSRSEWRIERGAPLLGEHNDAVLGDLLGLAEERVLDLTLEAASA